MASGEQRGIPILLPQQTFLSRPGRIRPLAGRGLLSQASASPQRAGVLLTAWLLRTGLLAGALELQGRGKTFSDLFTVTSTSKGQTLNIVPKHRTQRVSVEDLIL